MPFGTFGHGGYGTFYATGMPSGVGSGRQRPTPTTAPAPTPTTIPGSEPGEPAAGGALSLIQQAVEHYRPGGEFAQTRAEQLEGKRGKFTAAAESQLVGRGLAGTTVGMAIPGAFQEQVAAPWETETEMFRGARLMEAVLAQAGFTERQTAREQEVALARAQMELQERLANRQISAQEYNAAVNRLSQTVSETRRYARSVAESWDRGNTGIAGGAAGGDGYAGRLLGSLSGAGTDDVGIPQFSEKPHY